MSGNIYAPFICLGVVARNVLPQRSVILLLERSVANLDPGLGVVVKNVLPQRSVILLPQRLVANLDPGLGVVTKYVLPQRSVANLDPAHVHKNEFK